MIHALFGCVMLIIKFASKLVTCKKALPELDPELDQDEFLLFSHLRNIQNNGVTKICLFVLLQFISRRRTLLDVDTH